MKYYQIEVQLSKKYWHVVDRKQTQVEALNYVRLNPPEKYPMRVVRVHRTIVFEDKGK